VVLADVTQPLDQNDPAAKRWNSTQAGTSEANEPTPSNAMLQEDEHVWPERGIGSF